MSESAVKNAIRDCIMEGDDTEIVVQVQKALDEGMGPIQLIEEVLNPALQEVGDKFDCGDMYLPELIIASEAMEAGMAVLQPIIEASDQSVNKVGKVVMATNKGDVHDIGKNIVCSMLKANGFEVIDLGRDVAPTEIISRAVQENADIIGMSALLTTSLPYAANVVDVLTEKGIREEYQVFIGGGAATPKYAETIGCIYGGAHAEEAVRLMRRAMGKE